MMNSDMENEPFMIFYNSLWKIIKEYWIPEDNEEYWNELFKALNKLCIAHGNSDIVRHMSVAFLRDRERVFLDSIDKTLKRHKNVSPRALQTPPTCAGDIITLNGENYIRISALKDTIKDSIGNK